jgi:hypothetical protein
MEWVLVEEAVVIESILLRGGEKTKTWRRKTTAYRILCSKVTSQRIFDNLHGMKSMDDAVKLHQIKMPTFGIFQTITI